MTLTGKIKRTNQGDELVFDMELLESLGVIEYTVQNPSPEREQADTHQGVLLENLFALAEIDADATKAHAIAWDDYTVDIPISVTQWPVMITTRRNGERISFHDLGPLQVIFPYHRFDIEPVIYDPMWIHQVHTLEIQ
ncbi:MAG: hypothetical protein HC837_02810 [Chloroflexaceae bacterium]|nr:hypothetical protein [Chloroflexaceae bacterium]